MTIPTDALNEEYTIDTPENVSIDYTVAGIGNRFIAALIDSALLGASLLLAQVILFVTLAVLGVIAANDFAMPVEWLNGLVMAIYALVSFSLFWGYFIAFEWLWRGQTPGKRVSKIRVVRLDGSPPGFLDIVVRNLIRIIDFMPFGYGIGLVSMFFDKRSRRLGDLAAGVIVVKARGEVSLDDVASPVTTVPQVRLSAAPVLPRADPTAADALVSGAQTLSPGQSAQNRYPAIRRLRVADYELMQESLRRHDAGTLDGALLARVAVAMWQKAGGMGDAPQDWHSARRVLADMMEAYRQYHHQE